MRPSLVLRACVSWQPSCLLPSLYRWCAYKQVCVWGGGGACKCFHTFVKGYIVNYTCMCCVETFVTGIKIESSEQSPFLRADQEIKVAPKLQKSKDQEHATPIWPLTYKIKPSSTLCWSKILIHVANALADDIPLDLWIWMCVCVCSHAVKTYQQGDDQLSAQVVHWTSSLPLSLRPSSSNPSKVESSWKILLFIVSVDCTLFSSPNWPCKGGWQRSHCDVTWTQ